MASHACVFELQSTQPNASLGLPLGWTVSGEANRIAVSGGGAFYTSARLPVPLIPPSGHGPSAGSGSFPPHPYVFKVIGMVEGVQSPPAPASVPVGPHAGVFAYASETGEYFWQINGIAFSNAISPPIEPEQGGSAGRTSRPDRLNWSNDAGSALTGALQGPPFFGHFHVEYKYPRINPYQNLSHFLEFAEVPPDSIPLNPLVEDTTWNVPGVLDRLTLAFAQAPGRIDLGETTGGSIFVNDCNFTGLAPEGAVYIEPSDFGGSAPDRIPLSFLDNEASRFRFHPSVFIRRAAYYRGMSAPYADPVAIDSAEGVPGNSQVFRIVTVDTPPPFSNWLLIIDGAPIVVSIDHPTGADLRRPRDIWNQLWVPLLQGSSAVQNAVQLRFHQPFGGAVNFTNVNLFITRLRFMEYARCLPLPGTERNQGQPG